MRIRFPTLVRLAALLIVTLALSGCDKCGDYFWLGTTTPHSCKEGPAPH